MDSTINSPMYTELYKLIFNLYHLEENKNKLLFHGWHHIKFVHDKAIEFAKELNADLEIVASASLVHDLNYIFTDNMEPEAANKQIEEYLKRAAFSMNKIETIIDIVENAHLGYRGSRELSNETKALADADTLFKALPTTPILFASKYITQNNYDISKLAKKIITEQEPLMITDTYFYTKLAKQKYSKWANTNLQIWQNVLESLEDESIKDMLEIAKDLNIL